jgi:uncharacterized protein involved in exopolysaccharide biosynthesis
MNSSQLHLVSEQTNASARSHVAALFRHRHLFLLTSAAIFCMSLALTFLVPSRYTSQMILLVQNARGNYVITPERTTTPAVVSDVSEEQMNSEAEVLNSRDILDGVVDPGWSSTPAYQRTDEQSKAHDKAVDQLRKRLGINPVRKSHVIEVSVAANSPQVAHGELSRLLSLFLEKQRQMSRPPGTAHFFAGEANRYKSELEAAQGQLAAYQQRRKFVSVSDREATLERQITALDSQLGDTDVRLSETRDRIGTGREQLRTIPRRHATEERQLPNQLSVQQLATMLVTLQNKRTELLMKYQPQDRLVQETEKEIADTTATLHQAETASAQERATDVNPVWLQADGSLSQNRAELQALKTRRVKLSAQIAKLEGDLKGVEGSTVEFSALQRRVSGLENNYQLYTQKRDEAQIADAMDQQSLLNVAVVETPTYSVIPAKPKPVRDVLLGAFTALFLGSFALFFAETSRQTVATPRELEAVTQYPVLATVPFTSTLSRPPHGPGTRGISLVIMAGESTAGRLLRYAFLRLRRSA